MNSDEVSKRRGRPQKQKKVELSQNEELFSIHDNIFHAAVLLFTTRVFSKTPSSGKFNPTIGYSIYEKAKGLTPAQKQYYSDDSKAIQASRKFSHNKRIVNFYINSLTFAPSCVVDEFYALFQFILDCQERPSVRQSLSFLKYHECKYINLNSQVMDVLEVRTLQKQKQIRELIDRELGKLLEIVTYTLWAVKENLKENRFIDILETEEDLFQRGAYRKGRKKQKLDFE